MRHWSAFGMAAIVAASFILLAPTTISALPLAQAELDGISVTSLRQWDGPYESWIYEVAVRNDGNVATAPFALRVGGEECFDMAADHPESLLVTRDVPALSPGDEYGVLAQSRFACRRYSVQTGDGAVRNVAFHRSAEFLAGADEERMERNGDSSNWTPPFGGSAEGGFVGSSFWFTSGADRTVSPGAGVQWNLSNDEGLHRLYAYVPSHGQLNGRTKRDATRAQYQWRNQGGEWQDLAVIDQEQYADSFAYLGTAMLGANAELFLGDNVGSPQDGSTWVLFSTVFAVPVGGQ